MPWLVVVALVVGRLGLVPIRAVVWGFLGGRWIGFGGFRSSIVGTAFGLGWSVRGGG